MKAAVYVRVSTQHQASEGESLEMQIARARDVCAEHGWELAEVYQDVISGRKDKRPALQRFEKDLKAGAFGAVICYKVDRLGRSRRKMHELLELIQTRDIRLVSLTQQIDTGTASGRMMLSILIDFAVFEVEQLGERVSDTLLHVAKQGRHPTGNVPYGYRYEPNRRELGEDGREVRTHGRLVVMPSESEGVRLAFDHYQRTSSLANTARTMNQAGHRTRGGNLWDATAIRQLITNPLYGGERALRRWPSKGGKTPTHSAMLRTMPDWVMVPADHEPIVPQADAQAVREAYWTSRQVPGSERASTSPWAGLVVCAYCARKMRRSRPGTSGPIYRCYTRSLSECEGKTIQEAFLDIEVIRAASRALDAAGAVQVVQENKPARPRAIAGPSRDQQLGALKRKLERLEYRFENATIEGPAYLAEYRRIRAEIEAVQAQAPKPALPRLALPMPLIEMWESLGEDVEGIALRKRLATELIQRVVIAGESARVTLRPQEGISLPEHLDVPRWPANARAYLRRAWSAGTSSCMGCQTTDRKHYAKGLCKACYLRSKRTRG